MGTSMAFYQVLNTGFTPEDLKRRMKGLADYSKAQGERFERFLTSIMPPEVLAQMREERAAAQQPFGTMFSQAQREKRPVIGYSAQEKWLPLFEENLCEGANAAAADLEFLNKIFDAPIFVFSIFDSDVLFVSYRDAEGRIYQHAKANCEGYDEYDTDTYSADFPEFLLEFCGGGDREALYAAWEKDDYIFADDRMYDLCVPLGMTTLVDGSQMPENYQPIFAD